MTRTIVLLSPRHAEHLPRGALQVCPQSLQRNAFSLDAEPVHGMRASLYLLLCPDLREARGPSVRRPLRYIDPGEDERRAGALLGVEATQLETRWHRDRRCDRSLSARRGQIQTHARL